MKTVENEMGNGVAPATTEPRSRRPASIPTSKRPAAATSQAFGSRDFLLQTQERYRAIVEGSEDAIVGKTLDGIVTSWNRGAERIFGFAAEDIIGKSIERIIPAELRDEEKIILREVALGRRVDPFDTIRVASNGRRIPVSVTVSPIRDARSVVIGASKIARDLGERKRAEEAAKAASQARQACLEAERANQAKCNFLSAMSREIHAPLTTIDGLADLLTKTATLTREQRRYVDRIKAANAALRTVVDDVLEFSNVEGGKWELEPRPFSPNSLVRDALAVAHVVAARKNLGLHCSIHRDIPDPIVGDGGRLGQILIKLVDNAIKFTSQGSIEVEVGAEPSTDGRRDIRFSVRDTGIGVPAERLDRLFEPFSQADAPIGRGACGTGLGLAMCKRLVDLMGGAIGVTSAPGEGSTFWFTIGLVEAAPPAAEAGDARILIVDDLADNREIVEAFLGGRGYRIAAVGSAIDAIQMLGVETFDLVLMDIQMPVMDGVTATKRIRALPKPMRDVPILAMTGNVTPTRIESFLDAGMNGHIAKPISRAQLHDSVGRWGRRRPSSPAAPASSAAHAPERKVDELVGAVGVERARNIAIDFSSQLNRAFPPDCSLAEARREAHGLINGAGVLGLPRFVGACQALECEPADDPAAESSALARIRAERGIARDTLSGEVLPSLRDRTLRTAG